MSNTTVRERVSASYARAITKRKSKDAGDSSGACCKPSCCGGDQSASVRDTDLQADAFSPESLGYATELTAHPDVATQSMGCGNPLAFAEVAAGQTVVDLGSGAGFDLLIARDHVGATGHVIGIDMTDAMIATARENIRKAGYNNVEVRKGIIEQMPVESGTVDWVISNCVINLSPDKEAVFNEIARVLKPGGRFSISDIVAEKLPDWLRASAEAYDACLAGTVSEHDYLSGLRAAGLDAHEVDERIVYSKTQLRALAGDPSVSDFLDLSDRSEEFVDNALEELEGTVWSARFRGIKPSR